MNQKKSLTKNSVFYLIYTVLNVAFPLLTGIYVARILSQNSIGAVESAKNIAQYFVILSFLGIPTYGLREVSKIRNNKEELNKLYSELMIINSISTLFFSLSYFLLVFIVSDYRENIILYSIVGVSVILNFLNNSWLFEGFEEFGYVSLRNLIFKAVSFAFLVLLVRNQNDYLWYAAITVIGTGGNYLLNIIHSRKFVKFTTKNLKFQRHLKSIFFLVAVNFAIEIYTLVDVTMLKILCGNEPVAIYTYGSKINKILLQIISSFTMVLVPRIAFHFKEGNLDDYNEALTKTLKVILILSTPMIVGLFFVSDYLVPAVYGQSFEKSATVLKILSITLVISPIGYLLGSRVCLVTGHERRMIIAVGTGAISNIILNLIFIHFFQEIGASIASVISEIIVMVVYIMISMSVKMPM